MATTTPIDLAHLVQVVTEDDSSGGPAYRAQCSCGWVTDWLYHNDAAAHAAGVDHCEVATGPGDGLDRAMSDMLDIQDDLAAMVVWLAENWSADLPVPTVYGRGGGGGSLGPAGVELWAYCTDASDLTRIAHLLGVPPTDDDQPNPHNGARYREAVRHFGRVSLRAFTKITTDPGPVS